MADRWSEEDSALLREIAESSSVYEMAERFGRTPKAVRWQCKKLGVPFQDTRHANPGRTREWSDAALEQLRELAPTMSLKDVAQQMGVPYRSVTNAVEVYEIPTRGRRRQRDESERQILRGMARIRRDEKYPRGGPWSCTQCQIPQSVEEFYQPPNRPENHTCRTCQRDYRLQHYYGITLQRYNEMLEQQLGLCAICRQPEQAEKQGRLLPLSVDHNHQCCPGRRSCGKCVRGLLCTRCNNVLEAFEREAFDPAAFMTYLLAGPVVHVKTAFEPELEAGLTPPSSG